MTQRFNILSTLVVIAVFMLTSCSEYSGVPKSYHTMLNSAIERSGSNAGQIKEAIAKAPAQQKEAMAFLISYMPEVDLTTLSADFLLENVNAAFIARKKFEWSKSIPDSVFFNDVLPYASMNEQRDNWRTDFYNRFSPYVAQCTDIKSAIDSINKHIRDELLVDYNTKRKKPDQSPYESMEIGMASCSGLSILLTDAFRAMGIPSRIAGTPNWHDNRGNHNWNEVWIDGEWYFTEYYPSGLNKSWFLADAGKADPNDPEHAIFATSWKATSIHFPVVWDTTLTYIPGINVTQRYIDLYNLENEQQLVADNHVIVKVMMFGSSTCSLQGNDRVDTNVDVFSGSDQIAGGRTAGPTQDMNDVLEFSLEKNKTYSFIYVDAAGNIRTEKLELKNEPETMKLFME